MSSAHRIHLTIALSILTAACGQMALHAQAPMPESRQPPRKSIELSDDWSATVLASRTVAVQVNRRPLLRQDGKDLAMRFGGGPADSQKAKIDAEKALKDWGRFTVVKDAGEAELLLAILEETLEPDLLSEGRLRLRHTLVVSRARGAAAEPLWAARITDNGLAARFRAPSTRRIVERFRDAVEKASRSGN
jgi:hypothetical protein